MKKCDIHLKNYIILFLIFCGVIFIVFYLRTWYNAAKEYYQNNSIMSQYLAELKSEEITSYIIDDPEVVIYYAPAKDSNIKNFEKKFKQLMEEYEIKNDIIYIDSSKDENNNIISDVDTISDYKMNSIIVPNLIYIKDGRIHKVLYSTETTINIRDVRNFLIKCEVIAND